MNASAPAAEKPKWRSWGEVGGVAATDEESRGEATLFVPLIQGDKTLLFTEFRGKVGDQWSNEANLALGLRHMLPGGWNLGAWAGGDSRETVSDNRFWGIAGGFELLSHDFDARVNGYLAVSDPALAPSLAEARIEGTRIFIQSASEVPLSGVDGEIGVRLPLDLVGLDTENHTFRVYGGGFHFDDDAAATDVTGPKARLEWRIDDIVASLPGSRLTLGAGWRSDDLRGSHLEAGARLRIPFSVFFDGAGDDLDAQEVRMMDRIERDPDIVVAPSKDEPVEDAITGVDFDRVVTVNAGMGLNAPAAAAGGNTLIVADGAAGTFLGGQQLQADQTLLGGGGTINVRGLNSGVVVPVTASGTRPTFANFANADVLVTANNNHFAGFRVTGQPGSALNAAFLVGNGQRVVFQDIDVDSVGGEGIIAGDRNTLTISDMHIANLSAGDAGIAARDDNVVDIDMSSITNVGFATAFRFRNAVTISNTAIRNIVNDAVQLRSANTLNLSGVTVNNADFGVFFDNANTITIQNSQFSNIGTDALNGLNVNTIMASGTTFTGMGDDAFDLGNGGSLTLDNVTIDTAGSWGVSAADGMTIVLTDTSILNTGAEAIDVLDDNSLTLTNVTISSTSGSEGIDMSDDNVVVINDSAISVVGNRSIEMSDDNSVTVNNTVFGGTPTNVFGFEGTGNALAGSGNVDNAAETGAFCANSAGQTGAVSFTSGATCP